MSVDNRNETSVKELQTWVILFKHNNEPFRGSLGRERKVGDGARGMSKQHSKIYPWNSFKLFETYQRPWRSFGKDKASLSALSGSHTASPTSWENPSALSSPRLNSSCHSPRLSWDGWTWLFSYLTLVSVNGLYCWVHSIVENSISFRRPNRSLGDVGSHLGKAPHCRMSLRGELCHDLHGILGWTLADLHLSIRQVR